MAYVFFAPKIDLQSQADASPTDFGPQEPLLGMQSGWFSKFIPKKPVIKFSGTKSRSIPCCAPLSAEGYSKASKPGRSVVGFPIRFSISCPAPHLHPRFAFDTLSATAA
jgi:hypothetical protein